MKKYDCLIIEGGGFKTSFTAGVLDAFISHNYFDFDKIIGVSGGSIAASYYLSGQYRYTINAMRILAKDPQFANYRRALTGKAYLDIDYLQNVASKKVSFDVEKALKNAKKMKPFFVATHREKGKPEYFTPCKKNWIQMVIASCTLPFATKGVHKIDDETYFDGGWSDPLPIKWAIKNGSKKILVLRTKPSGIKVKQDWADYFGSIYFKSTPRLAKTFESVWKTYNDSCEYLLNPTKGIEIDQIAPKKFLKSGTYSYSKNTLMLDYRYGLDRGCMHLVEKS